MNERRWVVIAEDGRHVTLGRHTDPTTAEVEKAGTALSAMGLGGWLAITEGSYHGSAGELGIMLVRQLCPCKASWEQASGAFRERRRRLNAG